MMRLCTETRVSPLGDATRWDHDLDPLLSRAGCTCHPSSNPQMGSQGEPAFVSRLMPFCRRSTSLANKVEYAVKYRPLENRNPRIGLAFPKHGLS